MEVEEEEGGKGVVVVLPVGGIADVVSPLWDPSLEEKGEEVDTIMGAVVGEK